MLRKADQITMNTFNWFEMESTARQRQAEIAEELATQRLLREAGLVTSETKKARRVVLRYSTAIALISLLLLYLLH